jgi:hypothetical protein
MNTMKFITTNSLLLIVYKEKYVEETVKTSFIFYNVNWQNYSYINFKLSTACYAVRSIVHFSSINTLNSTYYEYFHSVIKYRFFFFWGGGSNSSKIRKISTLQNKIIRILTGAQIRNSCRSLFKHLQNLPHPCQYILSLIKFIFNNQEISQTNSSTHNINKRNKRYANLTFFKKLNFLLASKFWTVFTPSVVILKNYKEKFKTALRKYINAHLCRFFNM